MKPRSIMIAALLFSGGIQAQDSCHFSNIDIPRNEARSLELARVIEFRCDAILPQLNGDNGDFQFIAERYQAGKCVSRQCFSLGRYSSHNLTDGSYRGIISFGWHMDAQKLVGVHDTGYYHQPGFAQLNNFHSDRPHVSAFFKDSQAEPRNSRRGHRLNLYPIIGIRGSKPLTFQGMTITGRTGDIDSFPSAQLTRFFKNQPDAVIVYLSYGAGFPDLDYNKTEPRPWWTIDYPQGM